VEGLWDRELVPPGLSRGVGVEAVRFVCVAEPVGRTDESGFGVEVECCLLPVGYKVSQGLVWVKGERPYQPTAVPDTWVA